ncbi:Uridine kinase [Anaerovibrio sp. JC8]|nr:Uridine kinase [Anaerovibrio sp. JC8]
MLEQYSASEQEVLNTIASLMERETNRRIIIAIDGRCGAGKTTLAAYLHEQTGATVFHLDDFFLRPEQRTAERLSKPGENVDHERFLEEVLKPLNEGATEFPYQRFDCKSQSLQEPVTIHPGRLCIVEGSYSCHPALRDYYDYRIFMTVGAEDQMARIIRRNGPMAAKMFETRWIPLEEQYFKMCTTEGQWDCSIDTSSK